MVLMRMCRAKRLERQRRRALALLASCPDGCTEGLLLAHGFAAELITTLIKEGLATKGTQRVGRGATPIEVTRVKITEAGNWTL